MNRLAWFCLIAMTCTTAPVCSTALAQEPALVVAKWNHTADDSWEDTSNFGALELK